MRGASRRLPAEPNARCASDLPRDTLVPIAIRPALVTKRPVRRDPRTFRQSTRGGSSPTRRDSSLRRSDLRRQQISDAVRPLLACRAFRGRLESSERDANGKRIRAVEHDANHWCARLERGNGVLQIRDVRWRVRDDLQLELYG